MAHHSGFLYGMWAALVLGAVQILQPSWSPERALKAFEDWKGTFFQASAPFLIDLLDLVEGGSPPPRSLETFVVTGSAVPRQLVPRAAAALDTRVCTAWGSTETCMATLSDPGGDAVAGQLADGSPLDGVRLRVVDDSGTALVTGIEGHLEVSSRQVFDGYFGRPELTAEIFTPDGWYRSGDRAVIEPSGQLRIVGRTKDVINRGGEKVPVGEIEQLILTHCAVRDVALVAMPDDRLGERVCMFVTLRAGDRLELVDVQRFLLAHQVTQQYWPERVQVLDTFPRNSIGKIQKSVLRDRARFL
jgi:non-ribosomal peptide synthetase component E (peptide arylation enzyme)